MSDAEKTAFIIAKAILDYNVMVLGRRKAQYAPLLVLNDDQVNQLTHFAKQGVKVRLK